MKKLRIPLTAVALMLGVAGAFATQSPKNEDRPIFGQRQSGEWVEITPSTNYQCNASPNTCTAYLVNDDQNQGQVETVLEQGDFVQTP